MTKRVEVVKDVPDAKVAQVKAEFEAAGATVTTTRQPDGLWTVTATFDDDPIQVAKTKFATKAARTKPKTKTKKKAPKT